MEGIAIVGAGYWGKNLVRNFADLGVLRLICDVDSRGLAEMNRLYPDIPGTSSFADVLKSRDVGCVAIATPAETHYSLTREALLAGKDIFVEKPLALTVAQGEELAKLADEKARILMVGHLLQYHSAVIKLKEMIDGGELGRIRYIYSTRLNLGKIRREENILWSFAPHDISVILHLLNEKPADVAAHGGYYLHPGIADVTLSHLNFPSGVQAHIFVSWLHPYKEQKLVVVGDQRMLVFDDVAEQKLLLYPHHIEWINRIPMPQKNGAVPIALETVEPLRAECRHLLHCIQTRETPKTDAQDGLRVLAVLNACQRSLEQEGKRVEISSHGNNGATSTPYLAHPTAVIDLPAR